MTDLEIGGTPTVVRELAIRLNDPPAVHVEVACLAKWGPVADQLRAAGVDVTALGASGVRDVAVIRRAIRLIRAHRIDTVCSFLIHANVVAAIASIFVRDVRFFQSIQTTQPIPRWHWRLQAIAQEAAEMIVVPSKSVARAAREWSGVLPSKIRVIPNAVDRDMGFQPMRAAHGPEARVTVGFLGRLDPIKRISDLIAAMKQLDAQFELHIYGDGAERTRIESNLPPRVILHGATTDPHAAIASMDVLVLPSEAEGFGLVLIEAMAMKVPVVATDVPGIRDVVIHERTGLLVPVGRPDLLAGAITRLTDDDALRRRLVDAAYADVQTRFSWPTVLQQYRRVLHLDDA